jgi:hypothetical protein
MTTLYIHIMKIRVAFLPVANITPPNVLGKEKLLI